MSEPVHDAPGVIPRLQGFRGFTLLAGVILILDQFTKWLVVRELSEGRVIELVPRVLQLIYRTNTGAAWSMFRENPGLLTVFATGVAIGLAVWSLVLRPEERILRIPLAMILGGAVGNLVDRYRMGHVVDFIDAHWDDVYHFPTFNVADSAICIGMAVLIWMNLRITSGAPDTEAKNGSS